VLKSESMNLRQIFTLDARDNCWLEVASKDVDKTTIYKFINKTFDEMVILLSQKGVNYNELKNALIPHHNRREVAFAFNRMDIDSSWYGNDVFTQLIPLLDKRSSHSILAGDMLGFEKHKERIKEEFLKNLFKVKDVDYKVQHQFYLVYLNNLTNDMIEKINNELAGYTPYVGFLDLTHSSFMKTYLSMTLANCCLKFKDNIIFGHEPDLDNTKDFNMSGYRFEENGYKIKSLSDDYYGLFLSYKIERQAFSTEKDASFSINALTDNIHQLSDLDILVEEQKLAYLLREKEANLKRTELLGYTVEELSKFIKNKIDANYIYNLAYLAEHEVLKFNVMIDVKGKIVDSQVKMLASLEYQPKNKALRLITLF